MQAGAAIAITLGKKMIGLEITHNGKKAVVAGGDTLLSLSAVIAAYGLEKKTSGSVDPFGCLSVFGISEASEKQPQQMLTWLDDFDLTVGDEITIRFIEVSRVQRPKKAVNIPEDEEPNQPLQPTAPSGRG